MDKLLELVKVKYPDFSKGLKKVAEHFLHYPETFAWSSGVQVAELINVSETTVIRFCHALDYQGFSALQKDVRSCLYSKKSTLKEFRSLKSELKESREFSKKVMVHDAETILQTASRINEQDFAKAVDHLSDARQILVSGLRSSHAMAHWFSFSLDLIRGNVRLFRPDTDDLILRLSDLDEHAVFVAFSFHRYAVETINMAKAAKRRGAVVIGITDSDVAPIQAFADILFSIQLPVKSTLDAAPAVLSLINALIGGVSIKAEERFQKRTKDYEEQPVDHFFVE